MPKRKANKNGKYHKGCGVVMSSRRKKTKYC